MPNEQPSRIREIASALNRVNSESALKPVLSDILSDLLADTGLSSGAIRIETGAAKAGLNVEEGKGETGLCFDGLDAPACACSQALDGSAEGAFVSRGVAGEGCRAAGVSTVVCAPVMIDAKRYGLFFAADEAEKEISPATLESINETMADLAVTVERVRLTGVYRQRAMDMETVNTIGWLITSQLKLKDMVLEIVSKLGGVLETDEVNVITYDSRRRELSFLASYFSDGSNMERPEVYPLSDGINSWIIENRMPLLMKYDTEAECKRLGIRHGGQPAKSWLGAPMIYKDKVVGVVSVQSYTKTGLYDNDSVTLIEAVANQCAVAVENARLFEELIERDEEKERLYFSLTHDLLSLINPVSGFAKILKSIPGAPQKENVAALAENIIKATEKITRFAEDILVYAKIKSGKLALDISRCDALGAVNSAVNVYLPEFEMRGIEVTVNGAPVSMDGPAKAEPIVADLDRAQMERVFLNLIGNSVKHTRTKIEIEAQVNHNRIECRIVDDGDGVVAELCPLLFEEYYQADNKNKGVGLGLPSVKKIVEMHNGEIRAISGKGKGFCVEFSWPRTLADRRESAKLEPSAF